MDNMKCNNIHIMGIQQVEDNGQGIKKLFEEIITRNFPNLVKVKDTQVQIAQKVLNKLEALLAKMEVQVDTLCLLTQSKGGQQQT